MAKFIVTYEHIDITRCNEADYARALAILAYDCEWNLLKEVLRMRLLSASLRNQ